MNAPFAPAAVIARPKPKQLNEKAILVQLATSRARTRKRDVGAEAFVQEQLGDEGLTTYQNLFRDKTNPVNKLLTVHGQVYTNHVKETIATPTKGQRLLPIQIYDEYRISFAAKKSDMEAMKRVVMPYYDDYVRLDIASRSASAVAQGKPARASVADYPSSYEFESKLTVDLRLIPLPEKRHFLFDLSDEDIAVFEDGLREMEMMARQETVKSMLIPLKKLVDKLAVPIGNEGSVFRDSMLENVIEGVEQAKRLCIDDSPEIHAVIAALDTEVKRYSHAWLRESPIMRTQANKNLSDIADQMSAFM